MLITGGAGLVAGGLVRGRPLSPAEVEVTWRTTAPPAEVIAHRVELCDVSAVSELVRTRRPDVVVHTAYSMHSRADVVDASNAVARACADVGASLVHLSSDMVFDGEHPPYAESNRCDPQSDYGRWKLEAEALVRAAVPSACITRTSLVVSTDPADPAPRWLFDDLSAGRTVTLFSDEHRSPIMVGDLAAQLWALIAMSPEERSGVWHLPGPERLSRLELGRRLCAAVGIDPGDLLRAGHLANHPGPRPRDLTLRTDRPTGLLPAAEPVR